MDEAEKLIHQKEFASFVDILGAEIEQAQIKLVSAANIQLLLHYWKIGHFIIYNQNRLGYNILIIKWIFGRLIIWRRYLQKLRKSLLRN